MSGGFQMERVAQGFCLACPRDGRRAGMALPPAGVFWKRANAGVSAE